MITLFLFDSLYEEIFTNTSELMLYFARYIFVELILSLSIFIAVMLTFLLDLSWITLSSIDIVKGNCH